MTKRIISFLLVLILSVFCTMTVFAEDTAPLVFDEALLLDDTAEAELNAKLTALSEKYDFDFAVATVDSVDGEYIGVCDETGSFTGEYWFKYSYTPSYYTVNYKNGASENIEDVSVLCGLLGVGF